METINFSLSLPGETRFGWQRVQELPMVIAGYGNHVALARGGRSFETSGLRARIFNMLGTAGITICELPAQTREPEPEDVDAATALARKAETQAVIAIGGGSVLDLGKAVAALVPQDSSAPVRAYLEGVGEGRMLQSDPLPFIAIPTTAGTGSEATKNAVISSRREGFKKSLRDQRMLANVAIIDPELTLSLPAEITAVTGLDALTQLIEAYTSTHAQPITDVLAERGLLAARALSIAVHDTRNRPARERMSLAAYLSGVCLANAGLGAAHGIAAALGSVAPIGHGLACALALPWVMAANRTAVATRYARIAEILTGQSYDDIHEGATSAIAYVWQLIADVKIPRYAQLPKIAEALREEQLPALARLCHGNSLNGNPIPLTDDDLIAMLRNMREGKSPV